MNMTSNKNGFTLVELMITVAVFGILAAIAYPGYTRQVQKTRRADAEAALMELSNFMERFFTENNCYQNTGADKSCSTIADNSSPTLPFTVAPKQGTAYYNLSLSAIGPSSYTLQAAPGGSQTSDPCQTLTLSNTGVKTPTTSGCW